MVETEAVDGESMFTTAVVGLEDVSLSESQAEQLWSLWQQRESMFGACKLIVVPEWFASDEFGARRPLLFGIVEHDDPDSGAVLFSDLYMVDISIVENEVVDQVDFDQAVDKLDITASDDYIDEAGKAWIPRSLMTVFEIVGDEPDQADPSSITQGVLGS